jgi:hypothetical protein
MIFDVSATSVAWSGRCFDVHNFVAGHLHLAPRGENGPIVVPLLSAGTRSGDDLATGEIRGQLVPWS